MKVLKTDKKKAMKRIVLLFIMLVGISFSTDAQSPEYDDLVIYYADGDYERLLKKAEKYTLSDKTKKDALPYFYLAKCNFDMSKDQEWLDKYPKAFNDAIKFAGNCIKKDLKAEGTVYEDNIQFFTELKVALVEDIKNLVAEQSFMKLMGYIAKLHRFDKSDIGSYFLKAGAQYIEKDKSGGKITAKEAWERLEAIENVDNWRPIDFEMLKIGATVFCDAMFDHMRQEQAAKDLLGRIKQWLEDDEEFMAYYNRRVNGL